MGLVSGFGRPFDRGAMAPMGVSAFKGILDPNELSLGMNAAWINTWSGAWVFSNLMYHSELPDRTVGTGSYDYDQGLLTASVPTDKFRLKLADKESKLPAGVYTILNPDGLKVALGGWNPPSAGGWTTATEFTVNVQAVVATAFCLHVEGSITANLGNLAVILPGHAESWKAGNIWNSQFLDFYKAMDTRVIRTMDWTWASSNIETEWEHRARPNGISLRNPWADGSAVPYEFMCDLAKRLNAEIWVCVPHRASADYREKMAQLFAEKYPRTKSLWLEYGNEVWNGANPWGEGTNWVTYLDFTKYLAVADVPNQKFILANHGLSDGQKIYSFATAENRRARILLNWRFSLGINSYVKVLDANNFELHDTAALTTRLNVTTGMKNLLFCKDGEAGKVAKQHINFSELCLATWDIFDAKIGVKRLKRILSSQAGNVAVTNGRVAVAGVKARASFLAIAPYFDGAFFGAEVAATTGQLLPKFWATASSNVYMNVYPENANPTLEDQITGAGAIAHQLLAYVGGSSSYTNMTAVTGLVDGTVYKVLFLYEENGVKRQAATLATPSVGGSTVTACPSIEDQGLANKLAAQVSANSIKTHAAASGLPVICYEGGIHYHHSKPVALADWLNVYFESPEFADVNRRYLYDLAETGCKQFCHYGDSLGTNFCIANGYHDINDRRYKVFTGFKGHVPRNKKLASLIIPDLNIGNVLLEPAYPYVIHTFTDPTLEYKIISGDNRGNFAMVGNQLQLLNGNGVAWDAPAGYLLQIAVSDGQLMRQFKVVLGLGNAWYEADALFAWSPLDDTDTAVMNPRIGNPVPLLEGPGPTKEVDGLWNFGGVNRFGTTNAFSGQMKLNKPALWASVIDIVVPSGYYKMLWKHGTGNFMATYVQNTNTEVLAYSYIGGSSPSPAFKPGALTGKHVLWIYYDPATKLLHTGMDQVPNGSVVREWVGAGFNNVLYVGGPEGASPKAASVMKHGAMQFINRANMSLANALDIVKKMQDHHNIP